MQELTASNIEYLEEGEAWRLRAVRELFSQRDVPNYDTSKTDLISLAEGGCLMRPHYSILAELVNGAHSFTDVPFQIFPPKTVNDDFIQRARVFFRDECNIPEVASDNICIGFGSSHIFDAAMGVMCKPGDIILTTESYYHAFSEWPVKWGARLYCVKTSERVGFKIQASDLEDWFAENTEIASRVRALLIINPHTTGALYTAEELQAIADIVTRRGLFVLADEVFRGAEFPGEKMTSIASIPGMAERTITAHSGSKTRSTADMRIGWSCGPAQIIDRMIHLLEHSVTEIPLYLQKVATAILRTPRAFLDVAAREYSLRADIVESEIDRINLSLNAHFQTQDVCYIRTFKPQSGHYTYINLNTFHGALKPDGSVLSSPVELLKYFVTYKEDDIPKYVLFSSGYSKGHDDFSLYIAFAQLGFQAMSEAVHDYERKMVFIEYLRKNARVMPDEGAIAEYAKALGLHFVDAAEPDYDRCAENGRNLLREALRRMESALKKLKLNAQ